MNVLVIAPHPDDEAIGCGGSVCLHVNRGDWVSAVYLTSGELGLKHLPKKKAWAVREKEARQAAKTLKLRSVTFLRCSDWMLGDEISKAAALLRPLLKKVKPTLIYLPHPQEWHPDHKAALPIVQLALKGSGIPKPRLLGYEIWTPLPEYTQVENISTVMSRKIKSIEVYRSQLQEFDYVRAIAGLNQYRGIIAAKCNFAETFVEL